MKVGKRIFGAVLAALLASSALTACSRPQEQEESAKQEGFGTLSMGTAEEDSLIHLAGAAVASVINNTVPKTYVEIEASKGSPVNVHHLSEGTYDLAMVSGDTAYDAYHGLNGFEGDAQENLCVLAACYPVVSVWVADKASGLAYVRDIKGRTVAAGTRASATDMASRAVFSVMGIDETNTTIWQSGLSEGADGIRDGWADAAHGFAEIPIGAQRTLAEEMPVTVLRYTDAELAEIHAGNFAYFRAVIPAGTYNGQEEAVDTFGIKILLCASVEMDEELAYEIAMAMDVNGAVYTGGHEFMAAMQEKEFLCNDLPIPLHPGAERYYREMGYLR